MATYECLDCEQHYCTTCDSGEDSCAECSTGPRCPDCATEHENDHEPEAEDKDHMRASFSALDVSGLTDEQVASLYTDVVDMVDSEPDDCPTFYDAERVLRQRIGGQVNLDSYARTLQAGRR